MADIPLQLANNTSTIILQVNDPLQTGLAVGMFLATIALAIIAWRSLVGSNASTRDSLAEVKKSNELTRESNQESKESNRLTRESLNLKKAELKAALGQPQIEIVNTGLEFSGRSPMVTLYPNFRNDGKVAAKNIKIYHKAMDKVVELREIVKQEHEIKASVIHVPGNVLPAHSVNLNIANSNKSGIQWQKKEKPISVVVWFAYDYLDDQDDEVIFNVQYTDTNPDKAPEHYTRQDIEKARMALK